MVKLAEAASVLSLAFSSVSAVYSILYGNLLVSMLSVVTITAPAYFCMESRRVTRKILALLG